MKEIDRTKTPLLRDASEHFKRFKRDFRYNDFSKYSDNMVKNIYRDLKNIDDLKSSTVEGATQALETFGKTREFLDALSEDKREEFWDIFERAYKNLAPKTIDKYKYDVFNVLTVEMQLGQDPEELYEKIKEAFDAAYFEGKTEVQQGELFAENLRILFSESFDELFDQFM